MCVQVLERRVFFSSSFSAWHSSCIKRWWKVKETKQRSGRVSTRDSIRQTLQNSSLNPLSGTRQSFLHINCDSHTAFCYIHKKWFQFFFSPPSPLSLCFRLLFVFVTRDCYGTIFQPVCVCVCVYYLLRFQLFRKSTCTDIQTKKIAINIEKNGSKFTILSIRIRSAYSSRRGNKNHLTLFFFSFCLARTLAHNSDSVHSRVQVVKGYRVRDKRRERGRENEREKSNMRQGMPLRV